MTEEKWGLMVVDPDRTIFGELASDGRVTLLGSQVNKAADNNWKHTPDNKTHNYFVDVAESSTHMFLDDSGRFRSDLRGILLGGCGTWKEFMFKEGYFPYEVQTKIVDKLIETGDVSGLTLEALAKAAKPVIEQFRAKDKLRVEQQQIAAMRDRQKMRTG